MTTTSTISIRTPAHEALVPITGEVVDIVRKSNLSVGIVHLFVKHTTCGLTINENADPAVVHDLLHRLNRLAPWSLAEDRHSEGNSAAHLKSSLLGCSLSLPIEQGRLVLGTWQGIFLGEFDGPRTRQVHLSLVG